MLAVQRPPEDYSVPVDYGRTVECTEQLEQRVVNRRSTGRSVNRRTVLGRLGIAGNRTVTGVSRSLASASDGHDSDEGNFEAVDEYAESRFDPINSSKTHSQLVDEYFQSYMRSFPDSKTTTGIIRTENPAAALEVAL